MREIKLDQSEAKRRLLDAAESLFAEHGFETVSVRDITHLAKANVAAINYHFGTRNGLVALVITRYLTPLNEERLARLDALERKSPAKPLPPEEIIDALVRPILTASRKSALPENLAWRLLGYILALPADRLPLPALEQLRVLDNRVAKALAKSLPSLAADELAWRYHFVTGAMIHLLIHQELPLRPSGNSATSPTLEASLSRFMRFATAGLRDGQTPEPTVKNGPQATFDFG